MAACSAETAVALGDPDPWTALETVVRSFARRQVEDRSLNEALLGDDPSSRSFTSERRAHAAALMLAGMKTPDPARP